MKEPKNHQVVLEEEIVDEALGVCDKERARKPGGIPCVLTLHIGHSLVLAIPRITKTLKIILESFKPISREKVTLIMSPMRVKLTTPGCTSQPWKVWGWR